MNKIDQTLLRCRAKSLIFQCVRKTKTERQLINLVNLEAFKLGMENVGVLVNPFESCSDSVVKGIAIKAFSEGATPVKRVYRLRGVV